MEHFVLTKKSKITIVYPHLIQPSPQIQAYACNFIKKETLALVLFCQLGEFLKTIFKNIYERLLLAS